MFKVGDAIKWMCPLDNDYTYGEITALRKSVATVKGTGLYSGITAEVHLRYIEKAMRGGGSVGSDVRNVVNDQLLRLSYKDPKNIKRFLRNWGGLEGLSEKGDTVATCILTDLKTVTAIDLDKYHKSDRAEFNKAYRKGKLSHYQYMSIAYVLVLGYTQDELAFVMGVDQSVISKNINSGIKRIQRELRAYLEED